MIDAAMEEVSKFKAAFPYNDLPLLPPAGDIETRSLLKACITARTALAELKQATALLPNPAVLINTIPILEAQASSEIENIVTTTDDLFRYADDQDKAQKPATKEALRYRSALYEGFQSLQQRPLCTDTAVVVCSRIKAVQMQIRRVPGTALANDQTQQVIYTPPVGETLLRDKLANWERFIHEHTDIDPLIRMAVAHYQFEAIHPFTDGNGRTGRVLNLLMLIEHGLLDLPVLYLSRYIIRHRSDYYRLLLEVTLHGRWAEWIQYMLSAVAETAAWTTAKIQAIRGLEAQARDYIRSQAPKAYSRELVEVIFKQPYCRIQNVVEVVGVSRQTGARHLKELVEIGVLQEQRMGKEKLFLHPTFLRLLSNDDNRLPAYRRPAWNVESST
ncbi:addiction module protein [Xanthomonas translucens pv. arrhenatheri]|uniref:Protein adenylyltransferase n=1 Tax=Xanthomonas graminis pv. arrhenatheri LMG 727 TaxID=1195923 RepID=A0A0K2ZNG1_9XANT|nr:Fic family protein [Xanthomonas translucens]OAX67517.1 addiction module protein [Xanthomonas translucens pv. arrhenatheri]UKE77890.1 Fic family protein [Xanthomonas translucens pv. arrhenatheri]CTP86482.1 Adenosine monophosphate-protein transferase SoFic [Xanthomonas translucens pv. arrhenatheri LMG 727]